MANQEQTLQETRRVHVTVEVRWSSPLEYGDDLSRKAMGVASCIEDALRDKIGPACEVRAEARKMTVERGPND